MQIQFVTALCGGTTNCEPANHQTWLSNTDRPPLACLAAIPNAGITRHVIADAADLLQRCCAISDQGRAFHWGAHCSVLDAVRFGAAEDELAIRDVHLTAAKVDRINPILEVSHQCFGRCVAA